MDRRDFLNAGFAAAASAALAASEDAMAETTAKPANARSFYELRRYQLTNGLQTALTEKFLASALIPALVRLGLGPIGAFRLDVGSEMPAFYLLIPGPSSEALTSAHAHLTQDEAFLKAAEPFWSAAATAPSFVRVESSLLIAFAGWPQLKAPPAGKRIFQLRTYESPSYRDHLRKVEMFENGEFNIFANAGFHQVFYGSTLIGSRLPNLTYLISAPDTAALNASWDKFKDDPAWHKLSADPHYAFEEIVSNITSLLLSPLDCSQI